MKRNRGTKNDLSRRDFIKTTAVGVGATALAGIGASKAEAQETAAIPASWDYEADVVVIGTGFAGLSTAITAHDAGANVLILEKMSQALEGGNSKVSGNMFWAPLDVAEGAKYIKAMAQGQVEDEDVFRILSEGLVENLSVIERLGGVIQPLAGEAEWPNIPGHETVRTSRMVATVPVTYGPLYKLFRDNVEKRGIKVMYKTPAKELIQDPETKEILGVKVESEGWDRYIKANKAVVLACGGFEFDEGMKKQYFPFWLWYGFGTPGNTGDGIKMAQKVGADLWHMNSPAGGAPGVLIVPEIPMPIRMTGTPGIRMTIWVDKHGNRYVDESVPTRHGFRQKEFTGMFNGTESCFDRIPTWIIFDEALRLRQPLTAATSGWNFYGSVGAIGFPGHSWSKDNSVEIAKGWIIKTDSISELAAKIAADPDNANPMGQPTMDPATLEATVTKFNKYCAEGKDPEFGRPKESLVPINVSPFYAAKIWPAGQNTQEEGIVFSIHSQAWPRALAGQHADDVLVG